MENKELVPEAALQMIPTVEDILDFQVTNQLILVKPFIVETIKTKAGIILGEGMEADKIKAGMLQKGVVVNVGSKCNEIKPGMTVYYFKNNFQGMIRQDQDLYFMLNEYDIKAFLK